MWVADSGFAWLPVAMAFALILYMCVPENVLEGRPPITAIEMLTAAPNPFYRILKYALLVLGLGIVTWRFALARLVISRLNIFYLAFLTLVALSLSWSIAAPDTFLRLAALMAIGLVSLSCSLLGWRPDRLTTVIRLTLTLFLFVSLICCAVRPDIAKEVGEGVSLEKAWRGIFSSKNTFGESATVGAALWTYAWLTNNAKWWQFLGGMGIAAGCLVLSDSSTSIMGSAVLVALEFALIRPKVRSSSTTPVLIVLLLSAIAFYSATALNVIPGLDTLLEPLTKYFGKDTSFSGRSLIWEVVENHIAQHPVRGTGYGAYFIGPIPSSPSYEFVLRKIGYPPEAHNGYLEVTNDLGFVGLFCLFGFIIVYLRQCFHFLRNYPQPVLWIGLLVGQMIGNTTESIWFQSSSLAFVVLTAITFDMARMRVEQGFGKAPVPPALRNPRQPT